jgi:DNA-binding PadR family transcriptional regulator
MIPSMDPFLAPVQSLFLAELSTGVKTGKDLRVRLKVRGWDRNQIAFYRTIRKLKDAGLITARRIPRDPDEYRGSQCAYQLTEPGWDAVTAVRGFVQSYWD